jgi:hypothetical protein
MHVFVILEVSFIIIFLFLNNRNIIYLILVGTSMGHYTSYTKHIESEDWYYYNDETATKTIPGQEDYCNAYILFYKKQGKL